MRTILLLIPSLGTGGAQRVFYSQLEHLSKDNRVIGCVFNWTGAFPEDKNLNVVSLDVPAGRQVFSKLYNFILRVNRLRKIKKQFGVNISISHLEGADYINLLSRKNNKVICWIHGTKLHDRNIGGLIGFLRKRLLMPWLYRKADRLITVSRGIERELNEYLNLSDGVIRTIYNGFDVEDILRQANETVDADFLTLCERHPVIITHCRLSKQKNLYGLLHIFKRVRDKAGYKLVIVGDGELREELLQQCKELQLNEWNVWQSDRIDFSSDVFFVGARVNPFRYVRHASLFVMTSGWEGFPLALCEAMACGIPAMSTDCFTGPREVIFPDTQEKQPVGHPTYAPTGVLMPLAYSEPEWRIWCETICRVMEDKTLREKIGAAGAKRIRDFDRNIIVEQWVEVIENV